MEGLVVRSVGNDCKVVTDLGEEYHCLVKGNLRIRGLRTTNPVVVGDRVLFSPPSGLDEPTYIKEILPRRNYIIRKASNLSKESQILAANLDRVFLVVTVKRPETSFVFIDRFLATAEAYSIPVHLIFNKCDDYSIEELNLLEQYLAIYRPLGYLCHQVSALTGYGLEALHPLLTQGLTLLSGHSGVGKSTLINAWAPHADLRTGAISEMHETGMHTTTYSQMIPIFPESQVSACSDQLGKTFTQPSGSFEKEETRNQKSCSPSGYIIDTPGIKGFGTLEMDEANTAHYFREFFALSRDCRFSNCTHLHEPGCAVLQALEEGGVAPSRYKSYLSILNDRFEGSYRNDV